MTENEQYLRERLLELMEYTIQHLKDNNKLDMTCDTLRKADEKMEYDKRVEKEINSMLGLAP